MPTLDERIEAARKLEGYTPGPWKLHVAESFDGRSTFHYHEVWTDDLDVIAEEVYRAHNDGRRDSMRLIAAAPDLHCLALDLAAERERLLTALRLHKAWADSERTGPDYGGQSRDTHPDGERIWRQWWDNQLDLCDRAQTATDAALASETRA